MTQQNVQAEKETESKEATTAEEAVEKHQVPEAHKETTYLDKYCAANPDAAECRTYDV